MTGTTNVEDAFKDVKASSKAARRCGAQARITIGVWLVRLAAFIMGSGLVVEVMVGNDDAERQRNSAAD